MEGVQRELQVVSFGVGDPVQRPRECAIRAVAVRSSRERQGVIYFGSKIKVFYEDASGHVGSSPILRRGRTR